MDNRNLAIEYFVRALSTGERTASERLQPYLAPDVEYDTTSQPGQKPGRVAHRGKSAVTDQVSGLWPSTPGHARAGWSEPEPEGDGLKVTGSNGITLSFSFNAAGQIARVHSDGGWGGNRYEEVDTIPLVVRGLVNNALTNQTPMVVTYVDERGQPHSSLRGSVSAFSPTQLGIWIRHAESGLPNAITKNDRVSLVYNDRKAGSMGFFQGRARVDSSEEARRRVYEQSPEIEQTHDPERHGVAVIIDVTNLEGRFGAGRNYRMAME